MAAAVYLVVIYTIALTCLVDGQKPEQIHLSYGVDPTVMVVTWSTLKPTDYSMCLYNSSKSYRKAIGATTIFNAGHTQYIHRVYLENLQPGMAYSYSCGNSVNMSKIYTFRAMRTDPEFVPHIAFYGDLGVKNGQSVGRLATDINKGMYDAIFHVGDFAYNMASDHGMVGDAFMNMIQPLAASVPYMTCPGNHEIAGNFTDYKHRFAMPNDEDSKNMFYSFNIGKAHVISFSTEFFFFLQFGLGPLENQYAWLEKDLKEANKPENRKLRPWIITMGHRPMYCSNNDSDDCTNMESIIRTGMPFLKVFGLENLFYDNGVDLMLWAHEHSFERLWPLYNRKVYNGSKEHPYTNPGAPVHIITGSAGCYSGHDPFKNKTVIAPWSAFRTSDYGYSRMKIYNTSHLYIEQVSDDKKGAVVDKMWLIKDKHGPYTK